MKTGKDEAKKGLGTKGRTQDDTYTYIESRDEGGKE